MKEKGKKGKEKKEKDKTRKYLEKFANEQNAEGNPKSHMLLKSNQIPLYFFHFLIIFFLFFFFSFFLFLFLYIRKKDFVKFCKPCKLTPFSLPAPLH
jgi:hypothetical protein